MNGLLQAEAIWARSAHFSAKLANLTSCPPLSPSQAAKVVGRLPPAEKESLASNRDKIGLDFSKIVFRFG